MLKHTPLFEAHLEAGARMVDFGGWEMPIHYGSQIGEHHRVRQASGMFDVSHMTVVDLEGPGTRDFLSRLLANDVARLREPGKALYSCMLNERGGVIDDLIVYFLDQTHFRLVVNAATRDKDLAWLGEQSAGFDLQLLERPQLAMLAVQGPQARAAVCELLENDTEQQAEQLKPFYAVRLDDWFIARTGYTGEDGFEITLPADDAVALWRDLLAAGVAPCGLGARDTLRLEAGMSLYGQDLDEIATPLESGLAWTVVLDGDRDFIGRDALLAQRSAGVPRRLTGLILEDRGVLRPHQQVITSAGPGELTSGSFAPTLERAIGLARIPAGAGGGCQVDIRGRLLTARMVKPPFVRKGRVCDGILA